MGKDKLDIIIEGQLQNGPDNLNIDITNKVMSDIETYENKKIKRAYYGEIILSTFTAIISVLAIILIDYIFKTYQVLIDFYNYNIFGINFNNVQYFFQGFFATIIISTGLLIHNCFNSQRKVTTPLQEV